MRARALTRRGPWAIAHELVVVRSRPSVLIGLAVAALAAAALGAALGAVGQSLIDPLRPDVFADHAGVVFAGAGPARLLVVVLGVVAITGELADGQLASAFTAIPRRWRLLTAKAIVLGSLAAAAGVLAGAALILVTALQSDAGPAPRDLWIVAAAGAQWAASAWIGMGLGALLRSTGAAVTAALGVFMVVPVFFATIPDVQPYLPHAALAALTVTGSGGEQSGTVVGVALLVTIGWVAVLGGWALERADL